MTFPDLSFIDDGRMVEVEAVEGGRQLIEFSMAPESPSNDEEQSILGRPVDDAAESSERVRSLQEYVPHARLAFQQRGLTYPFTVAGGGDSLEALPGLEPVATRAAALSSMVRRGHTIAKDFEKRAFRALHHFVGGWGACVGAPREDGRGPEIGIKRFRSLLHPWEAGEAWPASYAASGDHGADGFVLLGRTWGGPVVFFQSKNTNFDLQGFPEELARMSEIMNDWFGKRMNHFRSVVPVCALNTVLTIDLKERASLARGNVACHIVDAVDILAAEAARGASESTEASCLVL